MKNGRHRATNTLHMEMAVIVLNDLEGLSHTGLFILGLAVHILSLGHNLQLTQNKHHQDEECLLNLAIG